MTQKISITIGRQCGSGGKEIGVRLGELLGFRVYDSDLLSIAAQKSGMHPEPLRRVEERATSSLLYTLAIGSSLHGAQYFGIDMPINDQLFITQTEIIKNAAEEENGIFIGRCADYVLRSHPHCINVFVYADKENRLERVCREQEISRESASNIITKTDKRRASYYNFYTGKKWGRPENYHLCVDSALLGVEGTAQMIAGIVTRYRDSLGDE